MGRQFLPLTVERLPLLVEPCSSCVFWERTPAQSLLPAADPADIKRAWLRGVLQEWGSAGRIALVDRAPAGFVTYAPARFVPRAMAFPTAPVSEDAVALITGRVAAEYAGQGLGKALLQRAARDVLRHGVRAIEVFATTAPPRPKRPSLGGRARQERSAANGPATDRPAGGERRDNGTALVPFLDEHQRTWSLAMSRGPAQHEPAAAPVSGPGETPGMAVVGDATGTLSWAQTADEGATDGSSRGKLPDAAQTALPGGLREGSRPIVWGPQHCLLPVDFLTAVGFYPVREHPMYPRMRMDLRTALRWREELGLAVERLFARPFGSRRPVGTVN